MLAGLILHEGFSIFAIDGECFSLSSFGCVLSRELSLSCFSLSVDILPLAANADPIPHRQS
jgi:hypothetical protein